MLSSVLPPPKKKKKRTTGLSKGFPVSLPVEELYAGDAVVSSQEWDALNIHLFRPIHTEDKICCCWVCLFFEFKSVCRLENTE